MEELGPGIENGAILRRRRGSHLPPLQGRLQLPIPGPGRGGPKPAAPERLQAAIARGQAVVPLPEHEAIGL